jgi:hypothetical protein
VGWFLKTPVLGVVVPCVLGARARPPLDRDPQDRPLEDQVLERVVIEREQP